jgi:hypothetical protein
MEHGKPGSVVPCGQPSSEGSIFGIHGTNDGERDMLCCHVAVLSEYQGHVCCKRVGHLVDKNRLDNSGTAMECPDCDGHLNMLSKRLNSLSYICTIFEN